MSVKPLKRTVRSPTSDELRAQFALRLNALLDAAEVPQKGKGRQKAACEYVKKIVGKISDKAVRKWLEGIAFPELDRIVQLALHFDVRIEWLLSGRGDKEVKPPTLSDQHRKLIAAYDRAPPEIRRAADALLEP